MWIKSKGNKRSRYKEEYCSKKKLLDREIQKTKRQYWYQEHEHLTKLMSQNQKLFWQNIGKVGISSSKNKDIPMEVISDNGEIIRDETLIMERWKSHFQALLNNGVELDLPETLPFISHAQPSAASIESLNTEISHQEVFASVSHAKRNKACGLDGVPVEVLGSITVQRFLTAFFNACFKTGVVPTAWNIGILHPIIKDSSQDNRDPHNYRGLMICSHMSKLYSSIINKRIMDWVDNENILNDEQNGFIRKRSCQDHLQSFMSIIETRKLKGLHTFVSYVDFSKAYDFIPRNHLFHKLANIGITGNILMAIKSLYFDVKSVVRLNHVYSDCFDVSNGLKQGCLISPIMFNLYIDDLITEINALERGLKIGDKKVSMLLYADDIVLMANTARDLQCMLDCLNTWCSRWGLTVNPKKTKVMHFKPKGRNRTNFQFACGNDLIELTERYKYLGLWFSENLDLQFMAEQVAASAHRALGVIISKAKQMCGMPYECYSKLYESLVQSILDYGSCVWGMREFDCINAVQHRAMRFFLGVQKKTPTASVIGDMGWVPQVVKQKIGLCRQLCRYGKMGVERINRCIMIWALNSNCNNWINKMKDVLIECEMEYLLNFETVQQKCEIKLLESKLMEKYVEKWSDCLNKVESNTGVGFNKLRTYCGFKQVFGVEPYVRNRNIHFRDRQALARIRCGTAPIAIELMRYSNSTYIPCTERICSLCSLGIEDEFHFIMLCDLYDDIRLDLFDTCNLMCDGFNNLTEREKFNMLLSHEELVPFTARACRLMFARRKEFTM